MRSLVLLISFFSFLLLVSCGKDGTSSFSAPVSFFSEVDLEYYPVRDLELVDMPEEQIYDSIIRDVTDLFLQVIRKKDYFLEIQSDWNSHLLNATSSHDSYRKTLILKFHGGLYRAKLMDKDAFALVVCHELGHFLGGLPMADYKNVSSEGQADYFATSKCGQAYFDRFDNAQWFRTEKLNVNNIPRLAYDGCSRAWGENSRDFYKCIRITRAAERLEQSNAAYAGLRYLPEIDRPSSSVINQTQTIGYPSGQCRLDTAIRGAFCNVDFRKLPSFNDETKNVCNVRNFPLGKRPACWYKDPLDR